MDKIFGGSQDTVVEELNYANEQIVLLSQTVLELEQRLQDLEGVNI